MLKAGDKVKVKIEQNIDDGIYARKGTIGKIVKIERNRLYPIRVKLTVTDEERQEFEDEENFKEEELEKISKTSKISKLRISLSSETK